MSHHHFSDPEFVLAFEECSFPPRSFDHEAHLRLAFILIREHGCDPAADRLCRLIRRFDATHGDGTKFNVTVTVAACRIVDHFMQKAPDLGFQDLVRRYPQLNNEFLRLIRTHYGLDIFHDPTAKQTYLEPDLLPFP